ncbi:tripartite tricarboxylate transporter TctB family protein [Halomonas sp. HAL1]|uniref:tripartite tricarboxylate transporter TctB family protein n=1 Tax=Halomonas sp. HAL1 TaxID=550984 RepID=UPI00022D27E9|nr:tripartite tricarboxylate transporter TctB family protein [Halomonas sp. HAL1]EHA14689.1 hypothetical protein HAL1_15091 [Halomonas sp. HAL1]WKV93397.1 tripartite tricarboxylate transporter TctB family protein [Halomonas sp. HAL1]
MAIYERGTGIAFMLLAVAVFVVARQYPSGMMGDPGPQLMPITIAVLMFPLGLVLALKKPERQASSQDEEVGDVGGGEKLDLGRLVLVGVLLLSMVGFVLMVEYLGTIVAIMIYIWIATLLLGERSLKAAAQYLVFALATGAVLYAVLYQFFRMSLPSGMFF